MNEFSEFSWFTTQFNTILYLSIFYTNYSLMANKTYDTPTDDLVISVYLSSLTVVHLGRT